MTHTIDVDDYYWSLVFDGEVPTNNRLQFREFLQSVYDYTPEMTQFLGRVLPALLLQGAENRYDRISDAIISDLLELSEEELQNILKIIILILKKHAPGRNIINNYYNNYLRQHCGLFINTFKRCDRPRILYTSFVPYFHILRESIALRKRGYATFLIALGMPGEGMEPLFRENFDDLVILPKNLDFVGRLLRRIDPELIHIQCTQFQLKVPFYRYVLEHKGRAKTVCAWRDILSHQIGPEVLKELLPDVAEYCYASERLAFETADASTCRYSEYARNVTSSQYPKAGPIIEMHPYPSLEFVHRGEKKYSEEDGIPRIVFAGQLSQTLADGRIDWPRIRGIGANMPSLIKRITAQGIKIDILLMPEQSPDDENLSVYRELAKADGNFRLLPGVAPSHLAKVLSRYDFGFNLAAMHRDDLDDQLTHYEAVGTKQFTYIEAGIPVIISAEFTYASRMIQEYGLGMAVPFEELDSLAEKIRAFDYESSLTNIENYTQKHNLDIEIARITDLYETLIPAWGPQ